MFKLSSTTILALLTATATSVVSQSIPQSASPGARIVTDTILRLLSRLQQQYKTGQDIVSCFCNGLASESDMSSCSTCLSANGQEELSGVLGAIPSACSSYQQTCQKECAFDTCINTDVACQCSETYLANIYQCASCNTRNNNVGATQVTDYESLANSCGNQNYTVPATSSSALPSPTGQDTYTAPTLAASASSYSPGSVTVTGFEISTEVASSTPAVGVIPVQSGAPSAIADPTLATTIVSGSARLSTAAPGASSTAAAAGSSAKPAASSGASSSKITSAAATPTSTSGALSLSVNSAGAVGALFAAIALF
ncbi:hypothetical protein QFC24_003237 [Naganishia onofrii]|uniref:Uncharacterized protein n=1 Tax=Naganishia onofrii TaxID=1851511 RepID=A0ACC2XKD5_9TREE|nr:hypothetical protein QFC24_003237 [Naganishia onofrii]